MADKHEQANPDHVVDPEHSVVFSDIWGVLTGFAHLGTEDAKRWLILPNPRLGDQTPVDEINVGHGYAVRNLAYLMGR